MKKIILVEELRVNPENGISGKELMKKYGPSENGAEKLIDKLLRAVSSGSLHIQLEAKE